MTLRPVVLPALAVALAAALTAGCTGQEPVAQQPAPAAAAPLPPVADLRVALEHEQAPAPGPAGDGQVAWRSSWRLTWAQVPGATGYAVHYRTSEGGGGTEQPDEVRPEPHLTVEVAAGTSPLQRLEQDRRAGTLFTSSQLLVAVGAVAGGAAGPLSPWVPVGDVPADGRPLVSAR